MYEYEIYTNKTKEYEQKIEDIEYYKEILNIKNSNISIDINEDIYNTTKLEGNQLTRSEVTYFLENGITIRGAKMRDFVQIQNASFVLPALKQYILDDDTELSEELILCLHRYITSGELNISESGQYRTEPVNIRYTNYIPPIESDVPLLMKELVDKYNRPLGCDTAFERICEFKRNFERIHPFIDGNGRTGRALMNLLFLKNGYGYISFKAEERDLYFNSLDNNTFTDYAATKMLESMKLIFMMHNKERDYEL